MTCSCTACTLHGSKHPISKAYCLLMRHLSPEQLQDFRAFGHFEARGQKTGRRYRINENGTSGVIWLGSARRRSYCVVARWNLPRADVMLMQKMLIESDEDRFLRTAL